MGLSSLILTLALAGLEFQKLVVVLDVEQKKYTPYIASLRLNRLCRYDIQLLGALTGLYMSSMSCLALLTMLLFVYELRKRGTEKFTVSALDFFEHKDGRKREIMLKLSLYLFLLCKFFLSFFKGR
jgi:hypothetical protein